MPAGAHVRVFIGVGNAGKIRPIELFLHFHTNEKRKKADLTELI